MKKVVLIFLFLFLISSVFAMEGPISVKANLGDKVSVVIRDINKMTMNNDKGVVNSSGLFVSKTFFSLEVPYNLRIIVTTPAGDFRDFEQDITSAEFKNGIEADCRGGICILKAVVAVIEAVEEVVEEVEVVNVSNESVVEVTEIVGTEDEEDNSTNIFLVGKAVFFDDNGDFNWRYLGGGGVVLFLFLVGFIFMISHRGKKRVVLDDDERELEETEEKVKETEDRIKKFKDGKIRRQKIYEAKKKLIEEERELKEMEAGGNEDKIEKQQAVVEKAEDKVDAIEG
ncbi:MAG: DUF1624 domain-containing protein [Nanoarchaeota archaeon]|nr:DUF1624 domain-containing protein [Nanoarchaeota archaeon]